MPTVVAVLLLAGCSDEPARRPRATAVPATSPETAAPEPLVAALPDAPLEALGWASVPDPAEPARARTRLVDLVRGGEIDAAARDLGELLAADLPHWRRAFADVADLQPLRRSARGAGVQVRISQLEAAWRRAASEGLPAVVWKGPAKGRLWAKPALLRAGVWLERERRFVPLGPEVPDAVSAIFDPEAGNVVIVAARPGREGEASVRIEVHSPFGAQADVTTEMRTQMLEVVPGRGSATFRALPGGATLLQNQGWKTLSAQGVAPAPSGWRPDRSFLHVSGLGTMLRPAGFDWDARETRVGRFTLRQNSLRVEGNEAPIDLGQGHGAAYVHSIVDDGANAVVLSSTIEPTGCRNRFVVDVVDLTGRAASRLAEGDGTAFARSHRGALFVQHGPALVRLGDVRQPFSAAEPVLAGVRLAAPLLAYDCTQ